MNKFFIRLDRKPKNWGDRIILFIAHLIEEKKKSGMVKSYISVIKAVLAENQIAVNHDDYLMRSLTKACKLRNDTFRIRMPIQKGMLNLLLKSTERYFG